MARRWFTMRSRLGDLDPFQEDLIFGRLELQVVPDMDGWDDNAHIDSEMSTNGANPVEEFSTLLLVHKG
jgi:hypothetical protein